MNSIQETIELISVVEYLETNFPKRVMAFFTFKGHESILFSAN